MGLSADQQQRLHRAMSSILTGFDDLQVLVDIFAGKRLADIASPGALPINILKVIQRAGSEGWTDQLLYGLVDFRPKEPEFLRLAAELSLTASGRVDVADFAGVDLHPRFSRLLEDVVRKNARLKEVDAFYIDSAAVARAVAKVERPGGAGTGFLVAPDLLLTCHHVLEPVIKGAERSDAVSLRFDHRLASDGAPHYAGSVYRLAENWLVAMRPPSPGERTGTLSPPVAADELDYCLVRLERPAGEETVSDRFDPTAARRGWIDLSGTEEASETAQSVVVIYQHPNGEPQKLDFGVHLGFDAGGARMRHNVNTKPGSSGSPILTIEHQPIALHHSGDPAHFKVQNGGVPLARILSDLEQRGVEPFWR